MKALKICGALLLTLFMAAGIAYGKADTLEMFTHATMTADIPVLEKILAPNFWYIGATGHIRDKEHFIQALKDKEIVIDHITMMNNRESQVGTTRLITSNGTFKGHSSIPVPEGLTRYTTVLADNKGQEQVVLFQATPVIPTPDCADGNCTIK